jgi:hypothetical protein
MNRGTRNGFRDPDASTRLRAPIFDRCFLGPLFQRPHACANVNARTWFQLDGMAVSLYVARNVYSGEAQLAQLYYPYRRTARQHGIGLRAVHGVWRATRGALAPLSILGPLKIS